MDRYIEQLELAKLRIEGVIRRSEYISNQNDGDLNIAILLIKETIDRLKHLRAVIHDDENDSYLHN